MGNSLQSSKKPKRIDSLTGLKAIAMLSLFWWHSPIPNPPTDLGARACEILFVASGFLVGYNYFYKEMSCSWTTSIDYCAKKLAQFWPLHVITLIPMIYLNYLNEGFLNARKIRLIFVDAFLLQAWSSDPNVYFSYSGIAWFLSALIFCYFMSPLLLRYAKKVKQSVLLFIIVAFIRVAFEYLEKVVPVWGISIHTSPIIRCMEFFIGMLMVPLFIRTSDKIRSTSAGFGLFSIIETAVMALTVFLMVKMNGVWMRGIFVLLYCLTVFIISLDQGIVSKILSSYPFALFGSIQFEFYLFLGDVLAYSNYIIGNHGDSVNPLLLDWRTRSAVLFALIIILSVVYKKFFSRRLSSLLMR